MITVRGINGDILTHFDNNVPEGNPYFEPVMIDDMESLVSSFSFSVPLELEDSKYLVGLNQVLAKDREGDLRLFIITDTYEEWTTDGGNVVVNCEDISISEMNDIIVSPFESLNFNDTLTKTFKNSGWRFVYGANWKDVDNTTMVVEDYTNMRSVLATIAETYDCQFKFLAQENQYGEITRIVEVYKTRGNDTGKYFYYDRDLQGIQRDIQHSNIKTAIHVTFTGYDDKSHTLENWAPVNPDQDFRKDFSSPLIINRVASEEFDDGSSYRIMPYKAEAVGDRELVYREAVKELKKYAEPIYTYSVDVLLLQNMVGWEGEEVSLGDTVWMKERVGNRELGIEARVTAYEYHEDDPSKDVVTFSNFREIDTTDAPELAEKIYIAWANSSDGTIDFSTTDSANKAYMGVYTSTSRTQSTDPSAYAWTRTKGEDGQSAPTLTLNTSQQVMKFKANDTPDGNQTITFTAIRQNSLSDVTWAAIPFIGDTAQSPIQLSGSGDTRTLSSSNWNASWNRVQVTVTMDSLSDIQTIVKVSDGAEGAEGTAITGFVTNESTTFGASSTGSVGDYTPGNGRFIVYDGTTEVTSGVTFAKVSNTDINLVIGRSNGQYSVGNMTKDQATAVVTATYKGITITKSLSFSKSREGNSGLNGDGQLVFNNLFERYPDTTLNTDGNRETLGWSFPGVSNTFITMLDPETDAPVHRIARIGGNTSATKYFYTKNIPVVAGTTVTFKGQVRTNYTPTSPVFSVPVLRFFSPTSNPADNAQSTTVNGTGYINGRTDGTVQVGNAIGASNVTFNLAPLVAGEWSTFEIKVVIPEGVAYVKFLTYNSNTDPTAFHDYRMITAVASQKGDQGAPGLPGDQGIPGEPGEDGKTSYVHIAYADDAQGNGFSQNPDGKDFIGIYTDFTEADSSDPSKYLWQETKGIPGDQGVPGAPGEDGRTPYFHTAWANSKDGTVDFSTTDATDKAYLGSYSDFTAQDSTDPSRYTWTELVGALEVDGINYALESRYENLPVQGGSGNYRRKHIQLSETLTTGTKVQFSAKWTNVSGTAPTRISAVMWNEANLQASPIVTQAVTGTTGTISGTFTLTNDAHYLYIYMGEYAVADANVLQFEYIVVNKGDKLNGWAPSPKDKVELNNWLFNSTWNLGGWGWGNNNTSGNPSGQYEILPSEPNKPNSKILHGLPLTATTQQLRSFQYRPVRAGDLVHISFEFRENELGNTVGNPFLNIRNFPEPDTSNAQANSLEYWYYRRSDTPDPTRVWNTWTRFETYCRITQNGYLSVQPYDGSNTGTHETWYREIMVTVGGSLQGDWRPSQEDSQFQFDENANETASIPRIYTQSTAPIENVKNGDTWFKMSNNIVLGVYVYGNGQWNEQAYDSNVIATNIIGKTITGSELNGNTINGTVITGSEFTNIFTNVTSRLNVVADGQTTIKDGSMSAGATYYLTDSSGNRLYKFANNESYLTKGSLEVRQQLFDEDEIQTSSSTAGLSGGLLQLNLQDSTGSYNGTLDAKLLESISSVKTTTVNVPATSNYDANSFTLRRFGQMVVVNFNFKTITNNGWVVLATIPQGYRPIALQMAETVVTSTTYRGNFATIYTNGSYQFAYLPSVWASGVTSDTYHGSMTYFTNDAWGLA